MLYGALLLSVEGYHSADGRSASGSGTAFPVFSDALDKGFLVTARHVVDPKYGEGKNFDVVVEQIRCQGLNTYPRHDGGFPENLYEFPIDPSYFRYHSNESIDIAACCLDDLGSVFSEEVGVEFVIPDTMLADKDFLADRAQIGDQVVFPGYPQWYDHNGFRPILRTGTLVSDPRNDYRWTDGEASKRDGDRQLAIEAFSLDGNSGSPVLLIGRQERAIVSREPFQVEERYRPAKVIGINAGHFDIGASHSGLSRVYKAVAIQDLIQELAADGTG